MTNTTILAVFAFGVILGGLAGWTIRGWWLAWNRTPGAKWLDREPREEAHETTLWERGRRKG